MASFKLRDFRNNSITNITNITHLEEKSPNITLRLDGNPVCSQVGIYDISKLCSTKNVSEDACGSSNNNNSTCSPYSCSSPYYGHNSNPNCFSAFIEVGYRLKSPSFSFFPPYINIFGEYLTHELNLDLYQLSIASYSWSPGPRLDMNLKIFPPKDPSVRELNQSAIIHIQNKFTAWDFTKNEILGPYEYLSLTSYNDRESGLSKGALAEILIGTIFGTVVVTSIIVMMILKQKTKYSEIAARKKFLAKKRVKVAGVKDFDFEEMALATNNFSVSMQIGQGGYGRVYKGLLNDGTIVAIKHAREGSLQGEKEFSTEIEMLSRLHHRNLVSLLGYCDDQEDQVNMAYQCGNMLSMIDKRMGSYPSECLEPFASLALRCCKDATDARPAIAEVVQVLQKIVQLMPPGTDISSTPSIQSHIYPMDIERTSTDISAENPYTSSDITGSDLLSGNIPGVAPR